MTRPLKKEFEAASRGPEGRYVTASLNFMAADTRGSLSADAVRDLETMREYVSRHPERADIVDYMARATRGQPSAAPQSRPDAPGA